MVNFIQISPTVHIGIQGLSSIRIGTDPEIGWNVLWNIPAAPPAGSRPDITIVETWGEYHVVGDDGDNGFYQSIIDLLRISYNYSRHPGGGIVPSASRYESYPQKEPRIL